MLKELNTYSSKPALYQRTPARFWDDPYIAGEMLKAHLNPDFEAATRKIDFVIKSSKWIADLLPAKDYPALLDLGCGPGIYAEYFTLSGYQVTGVDLSANSINYAKASALDKGFNITYLTADYLIDPLPGQYDLLTMIYCDFGALTLNEQTIFLHKAYSLLKPGGYLLFDVFTPMHYDQQSEFRQWSYESHGFWRSSPYLLLHAFYRYDKHQTYLNQYLVIEDKCLTPYHIWEHAFTKKDIISQLNTAGFSNIQLFGDVAGQPYTEISSMICALAQKPCQ